MNFRYSHLLLFIILVLFSGCRSKDELTDEDKKVLEEFFKNINDPFSHDVVLVSEKELRDKEKSTRCDTVGQVCYMGRKDHFDYYVIYWNIGAFIYKLEIPNNLTKKVIPYSKNEKNWLSVGGAGVTHSWF